MPVPVADGGARAESPLSGRLATVWASSAGKAPCTAATRRVALGSLVDGGDLLGFAPAMTPCLELREVDPDNMAGVLPVSS